MVGVLIIFVVNNLIWAVDLIVVISFTLDRPLPKIFRKRNQAPVEDEYAEATDDQIAKSLGNIQSVIKEKMGFDGAGNEVKVDQEEAVE